MYPRVDPTSSRMHSIGSHTAIAVPTCLTSIVSGNALSSFTDILLVGCVELFVKLPTTAKHCAKGLSAKTFLVRDRSAHKLDDFALSWGRLWALRFSRVHFACKVVCKFAHSVRYVSSMVSDPSRSSSIWALPKILKSRTDYGAAKG